MNSLYQYSSPNVQIGQIKQINLDKINLDQKNWYNSTYKSRQELARSINTNNAAKHHVNRCIEE